MPVNQRTLLRSQISKAWQKALDKNYPLQRINSERSLQAAVWAELNCIFSDCARRMFIEPGVVVYSETASGEKQRNVRYPDLVICNSREIIAVLELKYLPRGKPAYTKDLATLALIANARDQVSITNNRFRGVEADPHVYKLATSVLYVWAGVHNDAHATLSPKPEVAGNFLELHAVTGHDSSLVFPSSKKGACPTFVNTRT